MDRLILGAEIKLLALCHPAEREPVPFQTAWCARIKGMDATRVVLSVQTTGGAEVVLETERSAFRLGSNGGWEVMLPMTHRVIDTTAAA